MSKRKLLLADDSVTIQKVVNLTFADEGIEVVTVGNGSAAIEKLTEISPDLVLADVHMPGLTGYEVCEQIRQTAAYEKIPVMLLVGSFEPFDETEARRVGANDYLTKPFQSIRQLVQKVTSLLDSADALTDSNMKIERNTNLGDDEMIETFSGSDFDTNKNAVFSAAAEQNASAAIADNQFASANVANEDQDTRPTAPLSYVDIQGISSFSSAPSFTYENESVSPEPNFYNPKDSAESAINFAEPQDVEEQPEVFELDLSSAMDNANEEISLDDFGGYETNEVSMTNEADEISMTNETDLFETNGNQFSSNASDNQDTSNSSWHNSDSQPAIEFSDSSILELDTADSAPAASQDEDSILDLEIESADTISDFAAETEFDYQPEIVEPISDASAVTFETTSSPEAADAADTKQFPLGNVNDVIAQASASAVKDMNLQYSPEMIDAIAQKVVEKLSDKVIERIAWEIVPDKFDALMRQYIENQNR